MKNVLGNTVISLFVGLFASCQNRSNEAVESLEFKTDSTEVKADLRDHLADRLEWMVIEGGEDIVLDMAYADTLNFLRTRLYGCPKCQLRAEVALALGNAAQEAKRRHLRLVVFDCYRPYSVQVAMYEIVKDERYVAKPGKGSNHNKGCAVDLSLSDESGKLLDMGTDFDDFSEKSHIDYPNLSNEQIRNRSVLKQIMVKAGFIPYKSEWWHFNYKDTNYPVSDHPLPCK